MATSRHAARTAIIVAANRHRQKRMRTAQPRGITFAPKAFTRRTLQRAVCVVRRNRLVKSEVLAAAGFNAKAAR